MYVSLREYPTKRKMSELEYDIYNDRTTIVRMSEDVNPEKYEHLINHVNGKWISKVNGWVIVNDKVDMLKQLVEVVRSYTPPSKHSGNTRKYRRSRSPGDEDEKSDYQMSDIEDGSDDSDDSKTSS